MKKMPASCERCFRKQIHCNFISDEAKREIDAKRDTHAVVKTGDTTAQSDIPPKSGIQAINKIVKSSTNTSLQNNPSCLVCQEFGFICRIMKPTTRMARWKKSMDPYYKYTTLSASSSAQETFREEQTQEHASSIKLLVNKDEQQLSNPNFNIHTGKSYYSFQDMLDRPRLLLRSSKETPDTRELFRLGELST